MPSKRSRTGKQPKSYNEDSDEEFEQDSGDEFEPSVPLKKTPAKTTVPKMKATQKSRTNSPKPSGSKAPKKDVLKPKKSKQNKENIPEKNGYVPWLNRQSQQQRNHPVSYSSCHFLHFLSNRSFGTTPPFWQDQSVNNPLMNVNQRLQVYKTYMEFDRRITALEWHPKYQNIVVVCAKSGDIVVWDYEREKNLHYIHGTGANGSIQAFKFDWTNSDLAYTSSVNGTVACHDLSGIQEEKIFLNTFDLNHWYTSLDILDKHTFMVGDNKGVASILSRDGKVLWKEKLHKQKITHLECCPSNSNYIISGSVDRYMKVWDIRNLKNQESSLCGLLHEAPINSAYFSAVGNTVLTTDQKMELRVYAAPSFTLMQKILHPHRHFQHLTPIKAIWHPLRDIIVVGRYPDPAFPTYSDGELKSIDFFDAASGKMLHQHVARDLSNKIVSLNLFNRTGDQMLSAAGMCAFLWKPKFPAQSRDKEMKGRSNSQDDDDDDDNDDNDSQDTSKRGGGKKRKPKSKQSDFKVSRGNKKLK